jgi:LPS-assembly protein
VTSRLINPDTGVATVAVSLGQIYYFDDRLVNVGAAQDSDFDGSSAIAAELSFAPRKELSFRSSWLWNTDHNEMDQSSFQLSWMGLDRTIFNLGYSYRRNTTTSNNGEDIQQIDVSSYYPVNREWSVFFRSLYDLEGSNRVNDMAGIEYNNCCWRVRLVHQRYVDQKTRLDVDELVEYESATYVEFQLKGLGGVGTRVTEMLEEFIRGYRDSDI